MGGGAGGPRQRRISQQPSLKAAVPRGRRGSPWPWWARLQGSGAGRGRVGWRGGGGERAAAGDRSAFGQTQKLRCCHGGPGCSADAHCQSGQPRACCWAGGAGGPAADCANRQPPPPGLAPRRALTHIARACRALKGSNGGASGRPGQAGRGQPNRSQKQGARRALARRAMRFASPPLERRVPQAAAAAARAPHQPARPAPRLTDAADGLHHGAKLCGVDGQSKLRRSERAQRVSNGLLPTAARSAAQRAPLVRHQCNSWHCFWSTWPAHRDGARICFHHMSKCPHATAAAALAARHRRRRRLTARAATGAPAQHCPPSKHA